MQASQAAANAVKQGAKQGGLVVPDDDSLDPNQYYERRTKAVKTARDAEIEPYPHKFHTSTQVPDFVAKYKGLPDGQHNEAVTESLAGWLSPGKSQHCTIQPKTSNVILMRG